MGATARANIHSNFPRTARMSGVSGCVTRARARTAPVVSLQETETAQLLRDRARTAPVVSLQETETAQLLRDMAAKAKGKQPMVCEEVDEPLSEEEEEETDDEEETDVGEETDDEGAPLKASTGKRKRQVVTYTEVERLPATESMDAAIAKLMRSSGHKLVFNQYWTRENVELSDYFKDDIKYDELSQYRCCQNKCGCKYLGLITRNVATNQYIISSAGMHSPDAHEQRTRKLGLTAVQKAHAIGQMRSKVDPEKILNSIRNSSTPTKSLHVGGLPTLKAVQNFCKKARKIVRSEAFSNSMASLKDWCEEHSSIPQDHDEVFVLRYEFIDGGKFMIVVTTVRLLGVFREQASRGMGKVLYCIDATFKTCLEGRPVLPFGTVDWDTHFHIGGFCLVSEKSDNHIHFEFVASAVWEGLDRIFTWSLAGLHLLNMIDNALQIKNGNHDAIRKLPPAKRPEKKTELACHTHLVAPRNGALPKNKSKIVHAEKDKVYELIKKDMRLLHEVPSGLGDYVITTLFELLLVKWRANGEGDWCKWLSDFWRVGVHWSRAFNVPGIPHHNQALEALNRILKKHLDRKRFTFSIFVSELVTYLRGKSLDEAVRIWPDSPTLLSSDWEEAQAYLKKTSDSLVVVNPTARPTAFLYPTHETFKILCEEVKGDASVKEHEKVNGKPNSQFYSAVTARAQVLADEWAAAFLGPDDSVLKTYLYSTPTETRKLGAMTLLRSFHMVEELHPTEKHGFIQFSCTCRGVQDGERFTGFQNARKCKHILSHGLRTGAFEVPAEFKYGVVSKVRAAAEGRAKAAAAALDLSQW